MDLSGRHVPAALLLGKNRAPIEIKTGWPQSPSRRVWTCEILIRQGFELGYGPLKCYWVKLLRSGACSRDAVGQTRSVFCRTLVHGSFEIKTQYLSKVNVLRTEHPLLR